MDRENIFTEEFSYKKYCLEQNNIMAFSDKTYRLTEDDYTNLRVILEDEDENDFSFRRTFDREHISADPSFLEHIFETCFMEAYGSSAYKYTAREYSFLDYLGNTVYLDYVFFRKDGSFLAIEENGVSFHHPALIKKEKYRQMLLKQNSVVKNGGKLYRWDTESLQNTEKVSDEIKKYIGRSHIIKCAKINK